MQVGDRERREVVARALEEFLEAPQSEQAIALYDVEFADQKSLSVTAFVGRLDDSISLGAARKKLYLHLSKATRDLGSSGSGASASDSASEGSSAAGTVFAFLMRELVSAWKSRDASSIQGLSKHVNDELATLGMSGSAERQARRWAASLETESIGDSGSDDDMRRLLQSVYVWSCEWFGPVDTDRIVAEAVRSAERVPAASQFSPRKFL